MKNERYIDSVNKIEPSAARQEYMLKRILSCNACDIYNALSTPTAPKKSTPTKRTKIRRIAFFAALMVVVLTTIGVGYNTNWFHLYPDSMVVSGGVLRFYKLSSPARFDILYDTETVGRDLTADECALLFSGFTGMDGFVIFAKESGSLLHVESRSGELKVCFSTDSQAATDTLLTGNKKTSTLYGVVVAAGFFVTDKNSKGQRNVIYYADFKLDDIVFNVEVGGDKSQATTLKKQAAFAIDKLISNGTPNVAAVVF